MPRTARALPLIAAGGLALNIVDFGGSLGTPVLFVHGSFGHARVWDFVVEGLPPERSALALDLPGHGDSAHAPSEGRYSFPHLVEDLRAAVDAIGERAVLAGHSIGSAIAMHYAALYPATLAGAVFMDIDPNPPEYQAQHLNQVGARPPVRCDTFAQAVAREARVAPAAPAAVHEHLARHGYRLEGRALEQKFDQAFLSAIRTWDARSLLPRITLPALVLRGSESTVMSEEGYSGLLAGLPRAHGLLIAGATHQLHLDQPASVAAAIESFLCSLAALRA